MAEDDGRPPPIDTPEHRARLAARKGHATGAWLRDTPHPDEVNSRVIPPPVDAGTLELQVEALTEMVHGLSSTMSRLEIGRNAPPAKSEIWTPGVVVSIVALALTVGGSAIAVVQSTTRLADKVETMDARLVVVEQRQTVNIPKLDAAGNENKMQNDRIQSLAEAMAEERKARTADANEIRSQNTATLGIIDRLAGKVADIDKAVAVMQATGRRSDLARPPERDAQAMGR